MKRDRVKQLVEAFVIQRGNGNRVVRAVSVRRALEQVGFVHHDQTRRGAGADFIQDFIDDRHALRGERRARVDDMQEHRRSAHFFERRLERVDQHMRQAMNEADRIDQHHIHFAGELEASNRGIERREGAIRDLDVRVGEGVHQRRFAGVGIADQRDGRIRNLETALALNRAGALDLAKARLEASEAFAQSAAIDLELSLAGTASADATAASAAAADSRKMRPLASESRLQITELRDLDLEFAFEGVRALREDIENQLAPIDDANLELAFEIARLRGGQRVVENSERRALCLRELADLRGLALADEGARVGGFEALANDTGDFGAGALSECFELVEGFVGADSLLGTEFDSDQDGALMMFVGNVVRFRQICTSSAGRPRFEDIRGSGVEPCERVGRRNLESGPSPDSRGRESASPCQGEAKSIASRRSFDSVDSAQDDTKKDSRFISTRRSLGGGFVLVLR
jgi:hypothetical protein